MFELESMTRWQLIRWAIAGLVRMRNPFFR